MPRPPEAGSVGQAASLSPVPCFIGLRNQGLDLGGQAGMAARPTEPAARVCRRSRPVENVSGPDFPRSTEIALRSKGRQPSGAMSRFAGKRSINQRVPSPSRSRVSCLVSRPSSALPPSSLARTFDVTGARSRSTISVVHARMACAVARRARIAFGRETRRYFHSAIKWRFEQDRFSMPRHSCPFVARAELLAGPHTSGFVGFFN
jgi:hypothetical protein